MMRKCLLLLTVLFLLISFAGTAVASESAGFENGEAAADDHGATGGTGGPSGGGSDTERFFQEEPMPAAPLEVVNGSDGTSGGVDIDWVPLPEAKGPESDPGGGEGLLPAEALGTSEETGASAIGDTLLSGTLDEDGTEETPGTETTIGNPKPAENAGQDSKPYAHSDDEACSDDSGGSGPVGQPIITDPYFYFNNLKYSFNQGTGTDNPDNRIWFSGDHENAIQTAVNYLTNNPDIKPTGGLIYLEKGTFTGPVSIDSVPHLTGLVFQDYFPKELANPNIPFNPYDPDTWPLIIGNITVQNMPSGFSLIGLVINGMLTIEDCVGQITLNYLEVSNSSADGINISGQKGNVVLTNVASSNNDSFGAIINNTAGGNITIKNSTFNENINGNGILITTNGIVDLDGLSASFNNSTGMRIDFQTPEPGSKALNGFSKLTIKNAAFNDNYEGLKVYTMKAAPVILDNVFADRNSGSYGLYIEMPGSVTAKNISASGNHYTGFHIDNSAGTAAVSVTSGLFNDNAKGGGFHSDCFGLNIVSSRAITVSSISASGNRGEGVILNNSSGSGNIIVTSPAASGIAGVNIFSNNGGEYDGLDFTSDGLVIYSNGSVVVSNIQATKNAGAGLSVYNYYGTGNVTINKTLPSWVNGFHQNEEDGIIIATRGNVTISDSSACCNKSNNLFTFNYSGNVAKAVTVSRGYFDHSKQGRGIYINASGNITFTDVQASNNEIGTGAYLDNTHGLGNILVKTSSAAEYSNFSGNGQQGLEIKSKGTVTLSGVNAESNGGNGVDLNNNSAPSAKAVSITRGNYNSNKGHGVSVNSFGAITLTDVMACENGKFEGESYDYKHGAVLINDSNTSGSAGVTVKSSIPALYLKMNGNTGNGLDIYTFGAITVSNVIADANRYNGFSLANPATVSSPARVVNMTRCSANENEQTGVAIHSKGAVTLVDVSATGNSAASASQGLYIGNNHNGGTGSVTIKSSRPVDYYQFSGNSGSGLRVFTNGLVSISNVIAGNNTTDGIYIKNYAQYDSSPAKAVSLLRCSIHDNDQMGLRLDIKGPATLVDVNAQDNGTFGAYMGSETERIGNVTIKPSKATDYLNFSGNTGNDGIRINSNGVVAINNVIADRNGGYGAYINSSKITPVTPKTVTVTLSRFNSNGYDGLLIDTDGAVNLNQLEASGNDRGSFDCHGARVEAGGNVSVTGTATKFSNFNNNNNCGLFIDTAGNANITNTNALENGGDGITIWKAASITFTNNSGLYSSNLSGNTNKGLSAQNVTGKITLTGAIHFNDNESGLYLNNLSASTPMEVALKGISATGNKYENISVQSKGNITLNNINARANLQAGSHGVKLDNYSSGAGTGNIVISGSSNFSDNKGDGLNIITRGTVSISGLIAENNSYSGIYVNSYGNLKNMNFQNTATQNNGRNGIDARYSVDNKMDKGSITLNNVKSILNGWAAEHLSDHGIRLDAKSYLFSNSIVFGNRGYGIYAVGDDTLPTTIVLSNMQIFGNLSGSVYY